MNIQAMSIAVLGWVLTVTSVHAQYLEGGRPVESAIRLSQELTSVITRNGNSLSDAELLEVIHLIQQAKLVAQDQGDIVYPPLPPYPRPGNASFGCKWFDGTAGGTPERGVHLYSIFNGVPLSEKFYGNTGLSGLQSCYRDILTQSHLDPRRHYERQTGYGACECKWLSENDAVSRGWHMMVPLSDELTGNNFNFSIKAYGNDGAAAQTTCLRDLRDQPGACRVR